MPVYAYLDQRAVISLGRRRPNAGETEVRRQIEEGDMNLVLSPAHWVDTAGGRSDENSRRLAEFIDALRPFWLLERISLHRLEIRNFLAGEPFEETRDLAICRTVTEVVANLHGILPAQIVDTPALVAELRREGGEGRRALENAYSMNERAFQANRRDVRRGRLTPEMERRMQIAYLRRIGGIRIGTEEDQRLQQVPQEAIRFNRYRVGGHKGKLDARRAHDPGALP